MRFFAGFCLIANGCYLGYGVVEPIGDAEELVRLDVPTWLFGVFGAIAIPSGLRLWQGLGPEFGIGPVGKAISWKAALIAFAALSAVIALELATTSVATRDGSIATPPAAPVVSRAATPRRQW